MSSLTLLLPCGPLGEIQFCCSIFSSFEDCFEHSDLCADSCGNQLLRAHCSGTQHTVCLAQMIIPLRLITCCTCIIQQFCSHNQDNMAFAVQPTSVECLSKTAISSASLPSCDIVLDNATYAASVCSNPAVQITAASVEVNSSHPGTMLDQLCMGP